MRGFQKEQLSIPTLVCATTGSHSVKIGPVKKDVRTQITFMKMRYQRLVRDRLLTAGLRSGVTWIVLSKRHHHYAPFEEITKPNYDSSRFLFLFFLS